MKIVLPIKTVNELNSREHWRTRNNRARKQREAVLMAVRVYRNTIDDPYHVTITRISSGTMDNDGLHASMKHVADSIASWLHPERIVTYIHKGIARQNTGACDTDMVFDLKQRKCKRGEFGIEIEVY